MRYIPPFDAAITDIQNGVYNGGQVPFGAPLYIQAWFYLLKFCLGKAATVFGFLHTLLTTKHFAEVLLHTLNSNSL